ncbi:MAG: NlpC/P60 family protein [Cyclobacteriaceae bacterium]
MKIGKVTLSVIPVRSTPSDRAELTTQLLFGETYTILEEQEKWIKIACDFDSYEGWIDQKQLQLINSKNKHQNYTVSALAKTDNTILSIGSVIPEESPSPIIEGLVSSKKQNIIDTAKKYLNTPYLWGGKSIFGVDCSGFTQQVFKLAHINLPRDAYQQAELGTTIDFNDSSSSDLAFFSTNNKITHVGILLDNNQIIHASGSVRIDTITKKGIVHADSKKLTHTLTTIKRIHSSSQ